MTSKPLVSVIMPVFNCERYIGKAVNSILKQTHSHLEILVCDDASTDTTWKILMTYNDPRLKRYKNDSNKGVVFTKNYLFEKATGDYLVLQDGDDWSALQRIKTLLDEFRADSQLSACGSNSIRVLSSGKTFPFRNTPTKFLQITDCYDLPFIPSTLMIRAEVFRNLGGFNPYFSRLLAEDHYWVILIAEKYKLKYLDIPLYYYRFNENSITNTFDKKEKLVMVDLIRNLVDQRVSTGSDWVEDKNRVAIDNFILKRFLDLKWLSEQYRTMAAVQRDGNKRIIALKLIAKALALNPFSIKNFITLKYILL